MNKLLEPFDIKCSDADCENGLHYFSFTPTKKMLSDGSCGLCKYCKESFVDWGRVHSRNIYDIVYTIESLKKEYFRYHYWDVFSFDEKALKLVKKNNINELKKQAEKRLMKSVYLPSSEIFRDGMQTPKSGNVLFYSQHATATCCRKCIEVWHGKERQANLDREDIEYFTDLIMRYIEIKIP